MADECDLKAAHGVAGHDCDGSDCPFWRIASYVDDHAPGEGCAIKHFQLLGDEKVSAWLLSVKDRIEADGPGC